MQVEDLPIQFLKEVTDITIHDRASGRTKGMNIGPCPFSRFRSLFFSAIFCCSARSCFSPQPKGREIERNTRQKMARTKRRDVREGTKGVVNGEDSGGTSSC